jgi:hypothetical protein
MSKQILSEEFKRMQELAGMETGINYEGTGDNYEMFDEMEGLSNIQDLKVMNTKLRMLASDWMQEGFDKEDIKEYINFLINKI